MLKSVSIMNFFSFGEKKTIELSQGVNLLLGINGSGKTSFINALRVLTEGIAGDGLQKLVQEQWGGFDQIVNNNGAESATGIRLWYVFDASCLAKIHPSIPFAGDVEYCISIRKSGTSYSLSEKVCAPERRGMGKFVFLDFNNGNGRISARNETQITMQEISSDDMSGQELAVRQLNDPVHYLPIYVLRKAVESIAVYNYFNVAEGSRLRMPAEYSSEKRLRKSGENLANILNELKLNNSFYFDELETTFGNVNPNFKSIDINNLYGQSYITLRERNMNKSVGALHISDGTMHFLLLESIFYNPNRGTLVATDEPERGLHPDMIYSVAEMMKNAAKTSQLIAATHSPYLLNQFKLGDIIVFEKNESNTTDVARLSESDFPDWDGEYLPGQMWLENMPMAQDCSIL